jgi:hypothetical protein
MESSYRPLVEFWPAKLNFRKLSTIASTALTSDCVLRGKDEPLFLDSRGPGVCFDTVARGWLFKRASFSSSQAGFSSLLTNNDPATKEEYSIN